ncbi:MAG: hypothetical protein CL916_08650 [Deltaproteobacteria bacterium]|nr:hypothetical protein [Deltaproteobacteria bacterium]
MKNHTYEYRYYGVVAFVYGLLVGWFGFVKPLRHYLEQQEASDVVIRYVGNFCPPILGAFLGLGFYWLIHQNNNKERVENLEILGLGLGGALIVGNLCVATIVGFDIFSMICFALFGLAYSTLVINLPKESKFRSVFLIFGLLVVLGSLTGDLLLEYRVNKASRSGWLADYFKENKFAYKDRRAVLAWLPSHVGVVLFAFLLPPVWWVFSVAKRLSIRSYGLALSLMGLGYWFVPMSLTGIINQSFLSYPPVLRNQFRIACLFTHSSRSWPTTHYEYQLKGSEEWKEGPLQPFFPVDIFGHRTRFNRIVLASKYKNKKGKVVGKNAIRLKEIGQYIKDHWHEAFPEDPPIERVRFTVANHPVGKKHCMEIGNWNRPPLTEIPKKYKRDLGTYELKGEIQ